MSNRRWPVLPGVFAACLPLPSLLGCGDARRLPPADDGARRIANGGERLDAIYHVADGAEQFQHFFDRQLGIACEFAPDTPGSRSWRCMPTAWTTVVYLDEACTQPAMHLRSGESPTEPWVVQPWVDDNGPPAACQGDPPRARKAYRIAEALFTGGGVGGTPLPRFYARTGLTCTAAATDPRFPLTVFRLIPEEAGAFVSATLADLAAGGPFAVRRLHAADGSAMTVAALGRDGAPCAVQEDGVCVPMPFAQPFPGYFADAGCQEPLEIYGADISCGRPRFGVRLDGGVSRVFELGAEGSAFTDDGSGCRDSALVPYRFRPGREVAAELPRAEWIDDGTGALRSRRFVAPARDDCSSPVALDQGETFRDTSGRPCVVSRTVAGDHRCVRSARWQAAEAARWADAACQERLYSVYPTPAPSDVVDVQSLDFDASSPPLLARVFDMEEYLGPPWIASAQEPCAPYPATGGERWFRRAAEIPLTTPPRVEVVAF